MGSLQIYNIALPLELDFFPTKGLILAPISKVPEGEVNLTNLLLHAAGYRKSHIIMSSIDLGIFASLDDAPGASLEVLAQKLSLAKRSTESLLGGLVALDLVDFDGKAYENSPTAQRYLVPRSPLYVGEAIKTLWGIGKETWLTLTDTVREGHPRARQRTDEPKAEFWKHLARAIRPLSLQVAQSVARSLQWAKDDIKTVLDLGGGSGVFGEAFLAAFPGARVIQVDWPHVNEEARKLNAKAVEEKLFVTVDGNLFTTPWPPERPYDVVILSHILHQESKETIKTLLEKVNKHVHSDSLIVINEYCLNEKRNYPPYSLIFGLSMLLQNEAGGVYSIREYEELLATIGHEVFFVNSPVPPSTVLISKKHSPQEQPVSTDRDTIEEESLMPTSFLSQDWDTSERAVLEQWLCERYRRQILFASEHCEFWKKRLPETLLKRKTLTREDIETLPPLGKQVLRLSSPQDLIGLKDAPIYLVRGSGGTTGVPTPIFWTKPDWAAAIETAVRYMRPLRPSWKGLRVWNGYNQGHVSGPAFDDIVRILGGTPIPRHFKSNEEESIAEMERLKVEAIVLTPKSGSGKGGSLEDFLAIDPDFIPRIGIKTLIVSSTALDKDLLEELHDLGVETIANLYGSTEALPTGISCSHDVSGFHLCQGHIFLEVVDDSGKHVRSGESGLVVASRIGASLENEIGPAEGTQLFRYIVGDRATYSEEPCPCGLTTAKILNPSRLPNDVDKLMGGCERWD